ncbi:hypothetical protein GCM10027589_59380 [Actinocorallia lasiicapitis]
MPGHGRARPIQGDLMGDTRKKPAKTTGKAKRTAMKEARAAKQEKRASKERAERMPEE